MSNEPILIDREQLRFVKRAPTVRQLEYWAALKCKDRDYVIQGPEKRHFAAFSMMELAQLYFGTIGGLGGQIHGYDEAIKLCAGVIDRVPVDDTSEEELEEKLGRKLPPTKEAGPLSMAPNTHHLSILQPPEFGNTGKVEVKPGKGKKMIPTQVEAPRVAGERPAAAVKGKKDKTPKAPRAPAQPGGRPKGGSTGKVWDLADKLAKGTKDTSTKEFRAKVVEACVKEGVNQSTAGVQFGKWRATQK